MSGPFRQNALFAAEQWARAYEAMQFVDFRAVDMETLRSAMMRYVRDNYPEDFNDWIGSSEFVIKIDVLAWLAQNIQWRVDLNSRENFLALAERRESLLRLANNIAYSVSRVRGAVGEAKLTSLRTTEVVLDADGRRVGDVVWSDPTDAEWLDKWNAVLNAALNSRSQIGRPVKKKTVNGSSVQLYRMASAAPASGTYPFTASVGGSTLPFEIVNPDVDPDTGAWRERAPDPSNAFHLLYRSDGRGTSSSGTGYFFAVKQGSLSFTDFSFTDVLANRVADVAAEDVNETDVWLQRVASDGTVVEEWTRVDSAYGVGVTFLPTDGETRRVFEVVTRDRDRISVRFGDGKFGEIPIGQFRAWHRSSDPQGRPVLAADVRSRLVAIPYVGADGRVYTLTVGYSLAGDLYNAAPTESNRDIRYRANKVFYSQNRMVTAEDYNSFVLSDTRILKVKAVNRTYSGHAASVPLRDPTGTYSNVRMVGEDGRLYKRWVSSEVTVTADESSLPHDELISLYLQPLLDAADKSTLYHNEYPERPLTEHTFFKSDSTVNERSRGRFMRDVVAPYAAPLGSDAPSGDVLALLGSNGIVRFGDHKGQLARVDYVSGNGTPTNGVTLKDMVADGSVLWSVFPAFRSTLSTAERGAVMDQLALKRSFGLRWDGSSLAWETIAPDDLDLSSEFSLVGAGDASGAGADASWLVRFRYNPVSGDVDTWTIIDRGLEICFESDREIDFYHAGGEPVVDPLTGRALRDGIRLLRDNESRDSLSRRGLEPSFGVDPNQGVLTVNGDGSTDRFSMMAEDVDERRVFVERDGALVPRSAWSIDHVPGMDEIVFVEAPPAGTVTFVRYDPHSKYLEAAKRDWVGNGSTIAFEAVTSGLVSDNSWVFIDGLAKRPGEDYRVQLGSTDTERIVFAAAPANGADVRGLLLAGSGPAFGCVSFTGTGSRTTFPTFASSSNAWVFVDGQLETYWILDKSDPKNYQVVLGSAPANNSRVDVRVHLFPEVGTIRSKKVTATAGQDSLLITDIGADVDSDSSQQVLCWLDGVEGGYSYEDGYVFFDSPLAAGVEVYVLFFDSIGSPGSGFNVLKDGTYSTPPTLLGADVPLWITEQLHHEDGYTNENGVVVTDVDLDRGGDYDNPFLFRQLVLQTGDQDLALWRRVTVNGAEVWDPISESTSPRGTYESRLRTAAAGDPYDGTTRPGDVHYDGENWLVADSESGEWALAEDQAAFRKEVGRTGLRFSWDHYAPDGNLIDPSPTNIVDVYVLTTGYDSAYRAWAAAGSADDEPTPETTEELKALFGALEERKLISDAVVWRPISYKPLFGALAPEELRAKLVVVKSTSSTIPDNDLKLRVLSVVDEYFSVVNWDFGETFYFSELSAYIHASLPAHVQSVVLVPRSGTGNFGRLYQVRCEPDEMFVSAARPEDVEVASSLADSNLKIN